MEILQDAPPAFCEVERLFEMARQLPTTHRMQLRVGLASEGSLFAQGELDGFRQVNFFADQVRKLGWREHLLGGDDDMFGCDVLFSAAPAAGSDDDPSFIRTPATPRWPAGPQHG